MSRTFTDEDRKKATRARRRNMKLRAEGKLPPIKTYVHWNSKKGKALKQKQQEKGGFALDHPIFAHTGPAAEAHKGKAKDAFALDLLRLLVQLARRAGLL